MSASAIAIDAFSPTFPVVRNSLSPASSLTLRMHDPLQGSSWNDLVLAHPQSSFFHSTAWANVLAETYRHKPFYLQFLENEKTVALLPFMEVKSPLTGRRGVALPFSDFCPALISSETANQLVSDKIFELARERKWKHFELRGESSLFPGTAPTTEFFGHELDLRRSPEQLFDALPSATRRAIRKAEGAGLTTETGQDRAALEKFYQLHCRTRKRLGTPPQSFNFFRKIHEHILERGFGFIVLALQNSQPIAGAMFFLWEKKALFKFGASEIAAQKFRGNNLAMWEGLRRLRALGAETLHFGRTSLENDGLRRFKLSWGAREERLGYFQFDASSGAPLPRRDRAAGFHNQIFRRMPLALNKLAGTLIYPHLD